VARDDANVVGFNCRQLWDNLPSADLLLLIIITSIVVVVVFVN